MLETKYAQFIGSKVNLNFYTGKRWRDILMDVALFVSFCYVCYIVIRVGIVAVFTIPTSSMSPHILPGDIVVVNKLAYGGRCFNVIKDSVNHKDMHRLKGYSCPQRNDIVVFNTPYHNDMTMKMSFSDYTIKRCIAIPGDTFEICEGIYKVRGVTGILGNIHSQELLARIVQSQDEDGMAGLKTSVFPYDNAFSWSIYSMGPLYIPKKGDVIEMTSENFKIYSNVIKWETNNSHVWMEEGVCHIADSVVRYYTFDDNYYFMCGDNCIRSFDSRYWGIVGEDFIVGRVDLIL